MYQFFQQISAVVSCPGLAIATGACLECQLSDICYFVLNVSKRFGACNSLVVGCVEMVCGTRVVHFRNLWYTLFRVPHHEKFECIILKIFYLWQEYHRSRLFSTAARRHRPSTPAPWRLRCRTTVSASVSPSVAVLKQQWNGKEVVNHPQADHLNEQIRRVYDGLHEKMSSIASTKGEYDLSLLKKVKKTKLQGSSASFLDWLEERIDMRPVTESTRKQHKVMLKCLRDFGLIRFFSDLTPKNIRLWDDFIRKRVTAQASVHGYHKRLKPYIVEAIQFEKLESNPYDGMRISRGKSEGIKFLTEEERDRVEALELYGMTEKVRDMFIFSCYTGLAYSDLVKIKKSDVFMQGDDYCIRDKRMKTGMPYTIVLLPKAIAILKKYDYNLDLMSNRSATTS